MVRGRGPRAATQPPRGARTLASHRATGTSPSLITGCTTGFPFRYSRTRLPPPPSPQPSAPLLPPSLEQLHARRHPRCSPRLIGSQEAIAPIGAAWRRDSGPEAGASSSSAALARSGKMKHPHVLSTLWVCI
uniref:Uncharacterized protein n=1 Tax=Setaria viridis TaxID=4556 RepID=A0A4U6UNG1_SETVI|nr:hypothetical protein SEVIR_5G406100v2 [Setaria viridis]